MQKNIGYSLVLLCSLFLFGACSSAKNKYSSEELEDFHNLVESKNFRIESSQAYPLPTVALNSLSNAGLFIPGDNASRISLQGNSNFLEVSGDSISAQLPYYGERRISSDYNARGAGIEITDVLKDYTISFNEKKNNYQLSFIAKQKIETYQITIEIFPNKSVFMNVNSSHRNNIAYRGAIAALE